MAYRFDGISAKIEFAIDPFVGYAAGTTTFAVMERRLTMSTYDFLLSWSEVGSDRMTIYISTTEELRAFLGTNSIGPTLGLPNQWYLLVVTMVGGSVVRMHVHDGTKWTHSAAGTAGSGVAAVDSSYRFTIGAKADGDTAYAFHGDIQCAGIKKANMTDVQVEQLRPNNFQSWRNFGFDWLIGLDSSLETGGVLQDQGTIGTGDEIARNNVDPVAIPNPPGWSWTAPVPSYQAEVLSDNPLLYLRCEETSGSTVANIGSLGGSATAAGTFTRNISTGLAGIGVGIDLDGASGVVTYPYTASLDITGNVTYECWINADALQNATLISKGGDAASIGGYELQVRAAGNVRVLRAGLTSLLSGTVGAYAVGIWTHVAFTRSGNNYELFINGVSHDTSTSSQTIDSTPFVPLAIGHNKIGGTNSAWFNGKMDEVAVYNTALSAARIAAHYYAAGGVTTAASTFVPQVVMY